MMPFVANRKSILGRSKQKKVHYSFEFLEKFINTCSKPNHL